MKFHNPFESNEFIPGFCAIVSLAILAIVAISYQPWSLLAVIAIPFYVAIKYVLTGK
jgi:hypothetical protein